MRKFAILCLTCGAIALLGRSLKADVFVKSETTRAYMDSERKTAAEAWIAPGKSYLKTGNRVIIMREDLDKLWTFALGQKTYREYSLKEAQAKPDPKKPDVHTLWLSYLSEYEWRVVETGEAKDIEGFACRRYDVKGDADFAELEGQYWLADCGAAPACKAYRDYLLKQLIGDADGAGLLKLLGEHPNTVPVMRKETIERSIAPTITQTARLIKVEEAAAPEGTYDIPAGLTKIEEKGN